jgi:Uma2 family endonuclease
MSQITAASVQPFPAPAPSDPTPRLWTREEYYRMGDLGLFHCQRVELLEGEIFVLDPPIGGPAPRRWTREEYYRMGDAGLFHGPQKAEHYSRAFRIMELLSVAFATGHHIRLQGPIDFGQLSEPEPDVAVVVGDWSQYAKHHPKTAALIVEVSESRLQYDRTRKASLYARAGIADYWIVNLVDKQLEVRRDPRPDPSQHYGHGYGSLTTLVPPAVVNPLAAPQISLAVADLLP